MWHNTPQLIRDTLLAVPAITAVIADRLHYVEVPTASPYPRVWYARTSKARLDNLNPQCIQIQNESYSIEVFSDANIDELVFNIIAAIESLTMTQIPGTTPQQMIQVVQVLEASDDYQFTGLEPGKEQPKFYHAITAQLSIVRV